ncbi:hypothetical protein GCM10020001_025280 [Nonomuraea salmonea]
MARMGMWAGTWDRAASSSFSRRTGCLRGASRPTATTCTSDRESGAPGGGAQPDRSSPLETTRTGTSGPATARIGAAAALLTVVATSRHRSHPYASRSSR